MIPTITPSTDSLPQETPEVIEVQEPADDATDLPSSSSNVPSILITPAPSSSTNQQSEECPSTPPHQMIQSENQQDIVEENPTIETGE
jgi:hypothetical protein